MSASLLRKGLQLFNDDSEDVNGLKPNERHAGVSNKKRKQLKNRQGATKNKAMLKKRFVCTIDEFKKKQKSEDHLCSNLKYFLGTSGSAKQSSTQKIIHQVSGRQSRYQPDRPVAKPPEEKSVFTEEEFQAFQKEYFGKIVEDDN